MIAITLDGKKLFGFITVVMGLLLALAVAAFQARVAPSAFGHTTDEVQFNTTYFTAPKTCGMASFETIANSSGTTYCGITAFDDDTTSTLTVYECYLQKTASGFWQYRMAQSCGGMGCTVTCMKIQ